MRITYAQIEGYTKGTLQQFTGATGSMVGSFSFYTNTGSASDHFTLALYDSTAGSTTTDTIGSATSTSAQNYLTGFAIVPSASGLISSVGLDVATPAGASVRTAIYTTYSGGKFSGLLGQSASTAAVAGWNDLAVSSTTMLIAGTTYYVAFQFSSSALYAYYVTGGTRYWQSFTYGSFPDPTGTFSTDGYTFNMRIKYAPAVPYHRLWYSPSTSSASSTWNVVNYSAGTVDNGWTGALTQNAYYWFMWQWDSTDAGPSYVAGVSGTGIYKAQTYGCTTAGCPRDSSANSVWSGGTLSAENWSMYLTWYTPAVMNVSYSVVGGGSGYSAPIFNYVQGGVGKQYTLTTTPTPVTCESGTAWSVSPNPLTGSSGSERWDAQASGLAGTASAGSVVFTFYHQYQQTLSYAMVGDGSGYQAPIFTANTFGGSAPQTLTTSAVPYWFDSGSAWSLTNPLSGSGGWERWFTSQSVGGSVSSAQTIVFSFQHQYMLTMSAGAGGSVAPATGWQNAAAVVPITATSSGGYNFVSWTGFGLGSYSGQTNPSSVTMSQEITESAIFNGAVTMTVSYSVVGGGSGYSAPIFNYVQGGQAKTYTLTTTGTGIQVDSGSAWSVSPNPLTGSSGSERWDAQASSLAGTASAGTIVFAFYHQYQQTLSYAVVGGGSGYQAPIFTANAFGGSAPQTLSTSAVPYWFDSGSAWSVTNPLSGSTTTERWFANTMTSGTISSGATKAFNYYHQYSATVSYVVNGGGSPTSPAFNYVRSGVGQQFNLTGTPSSIMCDAGSAWSVTPNPLTGSTASEQWMSSQALNGTASIQTTVFVFQHQYMLTTGASPQDMGSAAPATGWQNAGSTISISATAGHGFIFHDWSGAGTVSYTGTSNPANVTINGPIMELAEFGMAGPPQVTMTVSFAILGSGSSYSAPVFNYVQGGANRTYTLTGTPYGVTCDGSTAWFVTPNPLTGSGQTERWISNQTLSGTASTTTLTITFQHQYLLTLQVNPSDGGTASPASGWQNAGAPVEISATASSEYMFQSWTGSGTGNYTGTDNPATATMNAPLSETASFALGSGEVIVRLLSSSGAGMSGGVVQYYWGGWQDAGVTGSNGNVTLQLTSGVYYFSVAYADARQEKGPLNVTRSGLTVTFQTVLTTVELRDSTGAYITDASGTVQYYSDDWYVFGSGSTVEGTVSMELLPLSYYFSMNYSNARLEKGPIAVSFPASTVTFQTVLVTVELRDSTGVLISDAAGSVQYYTGYWRAFGSGSTSGGTVSMELLPVSYSFSMTYANALQQEGPMAVTGPGPFTVAFQTSLVTVELRDSSGAYIADPAGTVQYYAGGWRTFGSGSTSNGLVGMQLLPVRYSFRMTYRYARQDQAVTVAPLAFTVTFQTVVVTLELRDSTGTYIASSYGTVQYYAGGWRTFGSGSTSNGRVSMELLPVSYFFSMPYEHATQQKGPLTVPSPGPYTVTFQTTLVTLQLKDSTGAIITTPASPVQYVSGSSWYTFGSGSTSGGSASMELLPAQYSFALAYANAGKQTGTLTVPATSPYLVTFQTTLVTIQFKDSTGATITTPSPVQYDVGGHWYTFGSGSTSGGSASMELLPVQYDFSIGYANAGQQTGTLTVTAASPYLVNFQTTLVIMQFKDSTGATITTPCPVQYNVGGHWYTFGSGSTSGGSASMELLPITYYSFSIGYAHAVRQTGTLTVTAASPYYVNFQTTLVTVQFKDSTGALIATPSPVQYVVGSSWYTFGSGSTSGGQVSMELLPAQYSFSIAYAHSSKTTSTLTVPAASSYTVTFQTVMVHSDSGTCTQYIVGGSWYTFTQDMEMLPGTYSFHFSDGTGTKQVTITAGTTNHIH